MRDLTNAQLDAEVVRLDAKRNEPRIKLVPFNKIKLSTERRYLVKGIIPHPGLTVIWGPPKSGKSFWTSDLVLHVALGWDYRDRRVKQGPVVYCCFEGQSGIQARMEAFRQRFLPEDVHDVPFFLQRSPWIWLRNMGS
jgi:RecA-family ATPase